MCTHREARSTRVAGGTEVKVFETIGLLQEGTPTPRSGPYASPSTPSRTPSRASGSARTSSRRNAVATAASRSRTRKAAPQARRSSTRTASRAEMSSSCESEQGTVREQGGVRPGTQVTRFEMANPRTRPAGVLVVSGCDLDVQRRANPPIASANVTASAEASVWPATRSAAPSTTSAGEGRGATAAHAASVPCSAGYSKAHVAARRELTRSSRCSEGPGAKLVAKQASQR